jgi:hypothetical protein
MWRIAAPWVVLAPVLVLAREPVSAPPEKVQLTIATLHAAALTTSRAAGDSTDAPFFVVSVIGPHDSAATIFPENGGSQILRRDEATGARPLTALTLASGDSVQVLVSVLENARVQVPTARVTDLSPKVRAPSLTEQVNQATRLVSPFVSQGAYWLGSVSLLITNEEGSIYWRRLDCVASCKVLSGPAGSALPAAKAPPTAGVVELSGNGGTYHLALQANRESL